MKSGLRAQLTVVLCAAAAAAAGAAPAWSQVVAYGEFTAGKFTLNMPPTNMTSILAGPTLGLTGPVVTARGISVGADLRGSFLGGSQRLDQISVGPTASVTFRRVQPYTEFLVGFGRYNDGKGTASSSSTDAEIQIVAGVGLPLRGRFGIRLFEYSYEQYYGDGGAYNPKSFSTGITYTLGAR